MCARSQLGSTEAKLWNITNKKTSDILYIFFKKRVKKKQLLLPLVYKSSCIGTRLFISGTRMVIGADLSDFTQRGNGAENLL